MPRNEFAREMAVVHWQAELAAAKARFDRLDSRYRQGQGSTSNHDWYALTSIRMDAKAKLEDVRLEARHAELFAPNGGMVAHPCGGVADADLFLEALTQSPG